MIKVLIATDSFKGSLSSRKMIEIFRREAKNFACIEIYGAEIADGGEGTLDAILASKKFKEVFATCHNPLFKEIDARYAVCDDVAVIESAVASGLTLIPYADGNAAITTTYGVGELILDALKNGAKRLYVTVGGSATNDGGIGALSALGYEFTDENGVSVPPYGYCLEAIRKVRAPSNELFDGVTLTVLTDVDNPLTGRLGATMFYGRQKGASGDCAHRLEQGMLNFASVTERTTGIDLRNAKGAGAGGGLAGGLMAYLGANVCSGIRAVLELTDFEKSVSVADAVVTGEGRVDEQSLHGKAVSGVIACAKMYDVPVYGIAGCTTLTEDELSTAGFKSVVTLISDSTSSEDSITNAEYHAGRMAKKLLNLIAEDAYDR